MRKTSILKQLFFLILISIIFASCKSSAVVTSKTDKKSSTKLAEKIIDAAADNLGAPYKYAGTTKAGFDCSGLVFTTFNQFDIKLPRSSEAQSKIGTDLGKNVSKAKKGDLIFLKPMAEAESITWELLLKPKVTNSNLSILQLQKAL